MYRQEKKYYQKAFFYALIMAVVMLLPVVIIDGGYMIFYGDFNGQLIPFYKLCVEAIQNGNFGWSWQTDLGDNFIGAYSHILGSPFVWIAALFPSWVSKYLLAPFLAVKLALSSLFAFIYIRRFVTKPENALIGGILYAFSGFSLYNIFFGVFHETIMFFPLLLIGLEESVVNKRRGAFVFAVAINAFSGLSMFVGDCVFLVLYFIVRLCCDRQFRISLSDFLCLAFESIAGVMIAGILFVPAAYAAFDVPRATNFIEGWNFIMHNNPMRYALIVESMFFPPEIAARSYMVPEIPELWSSVALYLPLFSMAGVIAFIKGAKKHWARVLLLLCLLMAFIPGLNASFILFINVFYTRWFYMPELLCCLVTVYVLEHEELDLKFGFKVCVGVVAVISALVMFTPFNYTIDDITEDGKLIEENITLPHIFGDANTEMMVSIVGAAVFLLMLYAVIRYREKYSAKQFTSSVTAVTIICSMMLGAYFLGYGEMLDPREFYHEIAKGADINFDDDEFFRMECSSELNNVNMLWGVSSIKSFQTTVPASVFEFYNEVLGTPRTVNSMPSINLYALRSLLGVKYFVLTENEFPEEVIEEAMNRLNVYKYRDTQQGFMIYENEYVLPMGFSYDYYLNYDLAKGHEWTDRLMVRSVLLTEEQQERFSDILTELPEEDWDIDTFERFEEDARERIAQGITQFSISNSGFNAMTDYDKERLVVFSVPYDQGWSAKIGGEEVPIEKVSAMFMALRVPAGIQEITFTYTTPGLSLGIILTIAGIAAVALYFVFWYVIRRHRPRSYVHLYVQDQVEGVKAHGNYIRQLSRQIGECPEKSGQEGDELKWPDIEESFMPTEKYDFLSIKPKKRTSKITEDDEAYHVMKELDSKDKDDIE